MKKRLSTILSAIFIICMASCGKQNDPKLVKSENVCEIPIEFLSEDTKSSNYKDPADPLDAFGEITIWVFRDNARKAEQCLQFSADSHPVVWLLSEVLYSFIAVSNIDLPEGYEDLERNEILSWYENASLSPAGKLPLLGTSDIIANVGTKLQMQFYHSWAKINLKIDASLLDCNYRIIEAKMAAAKDSKPSDTVTYDSCSKIESQSGKITLFCPTTSALKSNPFIELTLSLITPFRGNVTYRFPFVDNLSELTANEYSITFKPTFERLLTGSTTDWEVKCDLSISDFSRFKVVAEHDHSNFQKFNSAHYPENWQDLSSPEGSELTLSLVEKNHNITIPRKFYAVSQSEGPQMRVSYPNLLKTNYITSHLGSYTLVFSSKSTTSTISYSFDTIWQPEIDSVKPIPECPDSNFPSVKFGTELTEMTFSGWMKALNEGAITPGNFTCNVGRFYDDNTLLDNYRVPVEIIVKTRKEIVEIPVVTYDFQIIRAIEEQTNQKRLGAAYNVNVESKTIKYTLPSDRAEYQKFVYPNIAIISSVNTNVYVNNRKM